MDPSEPLSKILQFSAIVGDNLAALPKKLREISPAWKNPSRMRRVGVGKHAHSAAHNSHHYGHTEEEEALLKDFKLVCLYVAPVCVLLPRHKSETDVANVYG